MSEGAQNVQTAVAEATDTGRIVNSKPTHTLKD